MKKSTTKEKINIPAYEPGMHYETPCKLDDFDKKIIKELDIDARKSLAEMSVKVGLSRDAIRNRIKKLVDNKVIVAFKPIFNTPNMGFPIINYVCFSLFNPTEEQEKKFVGYLKNHKNVTYVASLIGRWDYIIDVMTETPGHFDKVLKEIRREFSNLIKEYEIFGVLQEYEYEEHAKLIL